MAYVKLEFKDKDILSAYAKGGTLEKAARSLGTTRITLYHRIKKSKQLKEKTEEIRKDIKSKKTKAVIKARDETQTVGIMVRQTVKGKILSDNMREILEATKGENVTIYSLLIDQLNLRELMAQARVIYDQEKIEYKEYAILMIQLHKIYATVTKTYEDIALKNLGDKTRSEIYEEVYNYVIKLFQTLEKIEDEENISDHRISRKLRERIKWEE